MGQAATGSNSLLPQQKILPVRALSIRATKVASARLASLIVQLHFVAQSLFEIHNRLQLEHKAATVTCVNPHIARTIYT